MKFFLKLALFIFTIVISIATLFWFYLGPVNKTGREITFVVPQNKPDFDLAESLYSQNLIKNRQAFNFLRKNFFDDLKVKEGGYVLSQSLNTLQIIKRFYLKQDLLWVNIYYCPRKEQVGEKLASILGWDDKKLNEWNNLYTGTDYYEGVFYPDTYLIPTNETVEQVAKRFTNNFEEKFAPLRTQYLDKNVKWTTGLKIASLIAREAAGRDDMKIVSSVIWNRLDIDMRLQIDATMQYTLGKNENGSWWGAINLEEKQSDSPYNTYRHEGLPPTPICSPNIEYIEAAINPSETDCLFYLHDSNRQIHCAKTYEEHKENIQLYL